MKINSKILCFALAFGGIMLAQSAQAQTWRWTWNGDRSYVNDSAGRFDSAFATYRPSDQKFSFNLTMDAQAGTDKKVNGYWLAISNGPNPKGIAGELAMFYFDASGAQPVLTSYGYNGVNGSNSYQDGSPADGIQAPDKIASSLTNSNFVNGIGVSDLGNGRQEFAFAINGSVINSYKPTNGNPADWKGVAFTDKMGIWLHPVLDGDFQYNPDGFLKSFNYSQNGWMDGNNLQAECVPEPASITAVFAGIAALAKRRKRA